MDLLLQETDFGLQLLQQQNSTDSLVFSPLSITLALLLVHAGAKGETRNQIRKTFGKNATDDQIEQHFANISASFLTPFPGGTQVNIANHVFSKAGFPIKQSYLETVRKLYNAGATSLDFVNKEATAKAINNFVCKNTQGHIKNIINSENIEDDLVAVLTNAIYFKADWQNKFESDRTFKKDFFASANSKRNIDFLYASAADANYAENDQFQVLSLPYKDNAFSMNIFLPKTRFGLSEALKSLDSATIQQLISNTTYTVVDIKIPKWKIETELKLEEALQNIGIKNAFDANSADFGNMADGMYVSNVAHKAIIEVDEDGTTAAAATIVYDSLLSLAFFPGTPKEFTADHPFFFMLSKDNLPLFVGLHY